MTKRRIGVLVRDGYQELEFWYPVLRFREEGAEVTVIGAAGAETYHSKLGYPVIPDVPVSSAPADLDALIIPGASVNEAISPPTLGFIESVAGRGAVLAASSEGSRALALAGVLRGRGAATSTNIASAVESAGGRVVSETVYGDGRIVTARSADDLPAFFCAVSAALDRKA